MTQRRRFLIVFVLALSAAPTARATTHVWTGGAGDGKWSSATNWMGGAPTSGEGGGTIVQFGTAITSTDDIIGLVVDQIHFAGNSSVVNGGAGVTLGIQGGVVVTNILADGGNANALASTLPVVLSGAVCMVQVASGSAVSLNGNISGNFGLTKTTGTGILTFIGGNIYVGKTIVQDGQLNLNDPFAYSVPGNLDIGDGSGAAGSAVVLIQSGDNIEDTSSVTIAADGRLSLSTTFTETVGSIAGPGSITVGAGATLTTGFNDSSTTFSGVLGGAVANLIKLGAGTWTLSGAAANTFIGTTTVKEGELDLAHTGGTLALNGPLVIGDNFGGAGADVVKLLNNQQILDTTSVSLVDTGRFNLNDHLETIGSLSGTGQVTLGAATGSLTVGGSAATTYAGVISGTGSLTRSGTGALTLTGTNTYSGTATVSAGTLSVSGGALPASITVAGGTFNVGSAAAVGPLTATGGTVAPGGITADRTASSGPLALSAPATYKATLNGTTGTTFTKLSVTGAATLGNATLTVTLGFSPVANDTFSILETTGGITGTFANLPEGGTLTAGSGYVVVHYVPMGMPTSVTLTFFPCAGETVVPTVTAPAAATLTQSVCQ